MHCVQVRTLYTSVTQKHERLRSSLKKQREYKNRVLLTGGMRLRELRASYTRSRSAQLREKYVRRKMRAAIVVNIIVLQLSVIKCDEPDETSSGAHCTFVNPQIECVRSSTKETKLRVILAWTRGRNWRLTARAMRHFSIVTT